MDDDKVTAAIRKLRADHWQNRGDVWHLISAGLYAAQGTLTQQNVLRARRQADAEYKRCNPDYEPISEDEDVGDIIIHAGTQIGDKAIEELSRESDEKQPVTVVNQKPRWLEWMIIPATIAAGAALGLGAWHLINPAPEQADPPGYELRLVPDD